MPLLADGRTGIIPLVHDTPLIFSHISIPQKLIISTGATSIKWTYGLNTNIIPTYGGEVGQVLSAYVDAMTITGQTRNNDQLKQIYDWFLAYMQIAGLHNREEVAVKFEYPERGWVFYIQPRLASNFHYALEEIAIPWMITAEIVADNDINYLSGYTMSVMGESVTFDASLYDIGFNVEQPGLQPNFGATLAENFQSLLGAWATGDFHHWGFDVLKSAAGNKLNPDAASIFEKAFGSDFISGKAAAASGQLGGSFTYTGPQNPSSTDSILSDIYSSCQAAGIPGVLGITIALIETGSPSSTDPGISPNSPGAPRSPSAFVGLFQTNANGRGGSASHKNELLAVASHTSDPVTKWYPSGDQISDFVEWASTPSYRPVGSITDASVLRQWAINIQGVGSNLSGNPRYGDPNLFARFLNAAKQIVSKLSGEVLGSGTYDALISDTAKFAGPDQGIDFTGPGTVFAVADGIITRAVSSGSGWPGSGGIIVLKLDHLIPRPAIIIEASHVYHAEDIVPLVSVGTHVNKGQAIARATGSGLAPGIEVGWASDDRGTAYGSPTDGKKNGGYPKYGVDFGNYVQSI